MFHKKRSRVNALHEGTQAVLAELKASQVPPQLRPTSSSAQQQLRHPHDHPLVAEYSLFRSCVLFIVCVAFAFGLAALAVLLFHEESGLASPRFWWLSLTATNAALLLYSLWSWVTEEVKGRPADSWLGSTLGRCIWGVAQGSACCSERKLPRSPPACDAREYAMPDDAWHCPWGPCVLVCACYLYRSLWQHCTVERLCMDVWPRRRLDEASSPHSAFLVEAALSPLMGRLVARRLPHRPPPAARPLRRGQAPRAARAARTAHPGPGPAQRRRVRLCHRVHDPERHLGPRRLAEAAARPPRRERRGGERRRSYQAALRLLCRRKLHLARHVLPLLCARRPSESGGGHACQGARRLTRRRRLARQASTLRCKWVAYSRTDPYERPSILVSCRMLALALAAVLVTYNAVEDVPMYWRLYREKVVTGQADPASPLFGEYDLPFLFGIRHGLRCQKMLSLDDDEWRPVMLWMSLNYVSLPLWMCCVCAITGRHAVVGFNQHGDGGKRVCD